MTCLLTTKNHVPTACSEESPGPLQGGQVSPHSDVPEGGPEGQEYGQTLLTPGVTVRSWLVAFPREGGSCPLPRPQSTWEGVGLICLLVTEQPHTELNFPGRWAAAETHGIGRASRGGQFIPDRADGLTGGARASGFSATPRGLPFSRLAPPTLA